MPSSAETASIIAQAIAPYVGQHMARSAVRANLEKLNIHDAPTDAQLVELLRNVQQGLAAFVGRDKSRRVIEEVREQLGLGTGSQ